MRLPAHGLSRAPLLGHNLVRLVYLDEGGIDRKAPVLTVAGVMVHGDRQYPEIDARILKLIEKYIPAQDRPGFVFHATDVFHGSNYFDRRKPEWDSPEKRIPVLNDLAAIIDDLHLPIVAGNYEKKTYGHALDPANKEDAGVLLALSDPEFKVKMIHSAAAIDCLLWADKWLAKYAPTELATVVHEDGTPAKRLIKRIARVLRSKELLALSRFTVEMHGQYSLPLKRIIDTVHFAEKADARPLQLADLCAFTLARGLKNLPIPAYVIDVVHSHMLWFLKNYSSSIDEVQLPSSGAIQ
jgi:hypothetical protein